jgi:hypothetical protein
LYEGLTKNSGNLTITKKNYPQLPVATVFFEVVSKNLGNLKNLGDYFEENCGN